ncbi:MULTISPECIES: LysR family transcriptional regulator [Aeromonas]|uniref:LysR family transcriptional regulator n=1 Tax=Aeromonas TaxID=642 RepID=UPI00191FA334|nr:LysR family transcriptional regulator [Aeromonas veronii]MBL0480886.1 LysR family transcriptional regulator [Aeromonas veronii]
MLDNLNVFLTIVEKGSLSAAARELGLSPATVSERLSALERFYEVSLIQRTTRSIRLTNEGRLLEEDSRRLLQDFDLIKSRLRDQNESASGVIKISAPIDFGLSSLVPMLDSFTSSNENIVIDLNLTDEYEDLISKGIDLAVRYGNLSDSTLRKKFLAVNQRVVCASPEYLIKNGEPKHPSELIKHDCLAMRFGSYTEKRWDFSEDGKLFTMDLNCKKLSNSGFLIRHWCLQGKGICLKSIWDVDDDIRNGRLVEILSAYRQPTNSLQLVYPFYGRMPIRIRMLIEHISNCFIELKNKKINSHYES